MDKRILLCLAHMSGNEQKYIQEAFEQNLSLIHISEPTRRP